MALGDFLARLGGGDPAPAAAPEPTTYAGPPGRDELAAALDRVEAIVAGGSVPGCVTARVERVTHVIRDTLPRLDAMRGSTDAYSVMATATDYLPQAVGGYLRLPRRFADTRPVDEGRTSLMVLVDQLDLLGATMDQVFDAVFRDDATALVAHGRFLQEKFGRHGGGLDVAQQYAVQPAPVVAGPGEPAAEAPVVAARAPESAPTPGTDWLAPAHPAPPTAPAEPTPPPPADPDAPARLAPPIW